MAHTITRPKRPGTVRHELRVATVQMKFAPTIAENLAKIELLLGEAAHHRADAVLLPECATTGYAYDFSRLKPAEIASAGNREPDGGSVSDERLGRLAGLPSWQAVQLPGGL